MPRIARLIVPEYPHHVTQRGNYRQDVFIDDADRRHYLMLMADYSRKFHLVILGYCLMNNHVHFIVLPKDKDSLADTFHIVHTRYSQYFNKKLKASGHLWQGRYYSCVLDERHLLAAARYIERNPVRVKIAKKPEDYIWSSAKNHIGTSNNDIIDTNALFKYIEVKQSGWRGFIEKSDDSEEISVIRKYTTTGRPLGNIVFVQKLEKAFGERLHALPVGRPKKRK
ncbi:MAG: transposase [Nitrospirae bacterium]|nr:transposase [Nitrospirota bacterium]